jgi:hypothetical protein
MKTKTTLLLTLATLSAGFSWAQCPIQQQTVTGTNVLCSGSGTVNLASSEQGVNYYLRRNSDNSIVTGPVEGTGSALSINTGIVTTPTDFNVYAKDASQSLDFTSSLSQYVSLGTGINSILANTNQITAEAWINLESYEWYPTIIGNYGAGQMQFLLRIDEGRPAFWIGNQSNSWVRAYGPANIPLNKWVHLAGTWDGTTIKVYVNGVLVASELHSGNFFLASQEVRIGASSLTEFLNGRIDNVRVWNVTKSAADINTNKDICLLGNESNLIAYYDFENISSTTLQDVTANNFDGTLINAPALAAGTDFCPACTQQMAQTVTIAIDPLMNHAFSPQSSSVVCSGIAAVNLTGSDAGTSYYLRNNATNTIVAGPFIGTGGPLTLSTNVTSTSTFNVYAEKSGLFGTGTALSFDGTNDFVEASGVTTNLANNDFTIEAWINTTGINEGIVTKSDATGWQPGEKSFYIDGLGRPSFVGWGNDFIVGGTVVNDGTWHHVAVTWNYSTSTGKMYVDGMESTHLDNYSANLWDNVGNTLKIGAPNYSEAPNYFSGMMDEIRIWNTTRTASQISASMPSCLFGNEPGLVAYYQFENETGVTATDLTGGIETGTLMNFSATPYVTGFGCGASCNTTMPTLYTATVNPLTDLALTQSSSSVICHGNTDITTSNSEQGVSYFLRDDANDNIVSGPMSGNGSPLTFNTGDISSTTTYNVLASKSSALEFDGVNDYLQTPVVAINGVFTFETWIKTNDPTPEWSGIITTNTYSGTGMFTQFSLSDNGTLRWEANSPNLYIANMTTVINDDVWHHVAVVSNGTSITFYVDGNVEYTTAFVAGSLNRNLFLMAERQVGPLIPGKMDDARIWTVARTQAQIQSGMNSCLTGSEPGLMIYYNFENNAGSSVVTDLAGGDQNGALFNMDPMTDFVDGMTSCSCTQEMTNKPTLTVNPISNQAVTAADVLFCDNGSTSISLNSSEVTVNYYLRNDLNDTVISGPLAGTGSGISFNTGNISTTTTYNVLAERTIANGVLNFDGNDDYVSVPSGINLANQSFTIEFWAKRNNSNAYNFIIGQGTGNMNDGLHIGFRDNNNFTFAFYGNDLDVNVPAAVDGNYHHWSCVYVAGVSGTDRFIYLDGVLVGSDDANGDYTGTGELKIGSNPGGTQSFNGSLDEIRIWTTARTQAEVQNSMNNCLSGAESGLFAYYNANQSSTLILSDAANNINGTLMNMDPSSWTMGLPTLNCSYCSVEMTPAATVTIKNSTTSTITLTECDNYTAPDMSVHTTSGIKTAVIPNMAGCDSTITIDLTIINSTSSVMSEVSCDSYTWSANGTTYNVSGTYMATIPNVAGCDSVITFNLTINNSSSSSMTATSCDSYIWAVNGMTYITDGTYTATIPNMAGCDSMVTLNLTINNVDATTTNSGATITANAATASYEWLNCDNQTLIAGETSQSFTALVNGNYAAVVTENGCTDTSACVNISSVAITENISGAGLSVYPNPTSGNLTITPNKGFTNTTIHLMTVDGKVSIIETNFTGNNLTIDMTPYASGIYFLRIIENEKVSRIRVVKN